MNIQSTDKLLGGLTGMRFVDSLNPAIAEKYGFLYVAADTIFTGITDSAGNNVLNDIFYTPGSTIPGGVIIFALNGARIANVSISSGLVVLYDQKQ